MITSAAIKIVVDSQEYCHSRGLLGVNLKDFCYKNDPAADRKFLMKILTRALIDVCMYRAGDERYVSAQAWLRGDCNSMISCEEIIDIVNIEDLQKAVYDTAEEDGVHRSKIRVLKKQLYNWRDDDSTSANT